MKVNDVKKVVVKFKNNFTENYDILCFEKSETGFVLILKESFKDLSLMLLEFNLLIHSGYCDIEKEFNEFYGVKKWEWKQEKLI